MRLVLRYSSVFTVCSVLGMTLLTERIALAQCPEQAELIAANRQAMQEYENLNPDGALSAIQAATRIDATCISSTVRSRTMMNLGVIQVGGFMNNAAGIDAFRRALCFDSSVQLDPLTSTPDIQTAFRLAMTQNQQQGCPAGMPAGGGTPTPTPTPTSTPTPTLTPTPAGGFELFRHTPVTEQQRMYPVPLYIEINPAVQAGRVVLQYRVAGETQYTTINMESLGSNAFGTTIPCETISLFDPAWIEYYIEIYRPDGNRIGTAPREGRERPHRTNMVQTLSGSEPAIPGQLPPSRCINCGDLPPGALVPDECRGGGSAACDSGFSCDVDDDCPVDGQSCDEGCCSEGGRRRRGGSGGWRPHAYLQIGAGWGGGYVRATGSAGDDNEIPEDALLRNVEDDDACLTVDPSVPPAERTSGPISNSDWGINNDACWHSTNSGGFGFGTGHLRIYAGGYILPFLSAGVYFRYQFDGFRSDAHYLWAIGLRVRYHILQRENMELTVGLGVQIYGMEQVFLNLKAGGEKVGRAFRTGGYEAIGIHVGYAYYFIRYVGLFVELTSDFTMGDFIWNLELTAGPALRF